MTFDPSQPFEIEEEATGFDPSQPFEVEDDKPALGEQLETMGRMSEGSPDANARLKQLADRAGVPYQAAKEIPEELERDTLGQAWRKFSEVAPSASKFLSENVPIFDMAQDDHEALGEIERVLVGLGKQLPGIGNALQAADAGMDIAGGKVGATLDAMGGSVKTWDNMATQAGLGLFMGTEALFAKWARPDNVNAEYVKEYREKAQGILDLIKDEPNGKFKDQLVAQWGVIPQQDGTIEPEAALRNIGLKLAQMEYDNSESEKQRKDRADILTEMSADEAAVIKAANGKLEKYTLPWLAAGVTDMIGQVLPAAAAGLVGGPAAAAAVFGGQAGGTAYAEGKQEGMEDGRALENAAVYMLTEGLGETVGLGAIRKAINASTPAVRAVGEALLTNWGEEQATQIMQQAYDAVRNGKAPEIPDYIKDLNVPEELKMPLAFLDEQIQAGIIGAFGGGTMAAAGAGAKAGIDKYNERKQANLDEQVQRVREQIDTARTRSSQIIETIEKVRTSKLKQRDTSSLRALIQSVGDAETNEAPAALLLSADAFKQGGIDPEVFKRAIPSAADQVDRAIELGGTIAIDIGELANITDSEVEQGLIPHLKVTEDEWTQYEAESAEQWSDEAMAEMQEAADKAAREADQQDQWTAEADEIRTAYENQLNAVGQYDKAANKKMAALVSAFYSTTASRLAKHDQTMTPTRLFNEAMMRAQGGMGSGQVFNQGGQYDESYTPKEISDEAADDIVAALKDMGSDDSLFRFERGATDNLVETIKMELGKGDHVQHDATVLEAAKIDPHLNGMPEVVDVQRIDSVVTKDDGTKVEASGYIYINEAKEIWVDLSEALEGSGLGAKIYTKVRDWADKNGAVFRGDPLGLSDDALLKRTEHMLSGIARQKSAKSVAAHVRQMDPYNDPNPLYSKSPLNKYIVPLKWSNDVKSNERELVKASWRNITTVMPELRHAYISENGQIIYRGAPLAASFDRFVQGLRQGTPEVYGGQVGDSSGGQVKQDRALSEARKLYGRASIQRFLLANTAARESSSDTRRLVLARASGQLLQLTDEKPFYQNESAPRGAFDRNKLNIYLLEGADLSTFLHESGHFFLEMYARYADQSAEIGADMDALLKWFGVKGDDQAARLAAWRAMSVDQQRDMHEQFAESFEQYLFSGKAPSVELQPVFSTFRRWLSSVYKSLARFVAGHSGAKLNPEVAAIMDRMLATQEQIDEMTQARDARPLFANAEQAGMTQAQWDAYMQDQVRSVEQAADTLVARSLRDMKWLTNAKNKQLRKLQREAQALRAQVQMEARRTVLSSPEYRAWMALKRPLDKVEKQKRGKSKFVDPEVDDLLAAIAKHGGLDMEEVTSSWGTDPADFYKKGGVFGKPVLRKTGGLSIEHMAEKLQEDGYLSPDRNHKFDQSEFEEKLDRAARGDSIYSMFANYDLLLYGDQQRMYADQDNIDHIGIRLNRGDLLDMYGTNNPEVKWHRPINTAGQLFHGFPIDTKAEAFKKWFGDSKVVDKDGKPLVVYHGTGAANDFTKFEGRRAYYFTKSPQVANSYAKQSAKDNFILWRESAERVMPVYLAIQNPLVIDAGFNKYDPNIVEGNLDKARYEKDAAGNRYDGMIVKNIIDDYEQRGKPSDIYLAFRPEQIKSAIGNAGTYDPNDPDILHQPAYHGSPYKFDKFSLEHMGKGEGAQAYGWGLYFAGAKEVAEYYRNALSDTKYVSDGRQLYDNEAWAAQFLLTAEPKMNAKAAKKAASVAISQESEYGRKTTKEIHDLIDDLVKTDLKEAAGQLYKVEIPEDDTYLLWDKPLSEQPKAVKDALGNQMAIKISNSATGADIYSRMAAHFGGAATDGAKERASKRMHQLGINGIKYLDGSSRGAGEGNYNYVIFDDNAIEIIETFYQNKDGENQEGDRPVTGNIRTLEGMGMVSDDGLHPDVVAELFGLSSGDELVRKLLTMDDPFTAVDKLTDKIMLERYSEFTDPKEMERMAEAAIHNESRVRFVATELAMLNKAQGGQKDLKRIIDAARLYAQDLLAGQRISDIRPSKHADDAARAGKESAREFAKGNLAATIMAKRNQVLHTELVRQAHAAKDEVDKGLKYFARIEKAVNNGVLDADYAQQIIGLLQRHDLRKSVSLIDLERRESLAAWVQAQQDAGFEPMIPENLLMEAGKTHYKRMTLDEFRELVDAVKNVELIVWLKYRLVQNARKRELAAAAADIGQAIEQNATGEVPVRIERNSVKDRIFDLANGFLYMHRKFASMIRQMDGWKDGGVLWDYFVKTMNDAGDREAVMREQATMAMADLMKPLHKSGGFGMMPKKLFITQIGTSLTREGRIMVALNWGNEGNRQRLMDGEGWDVNQVNAILATLNADDWKFVQGVWDHLETYREKVGEQQKRLSGVEPKWIEASPFMVAGRDGKTYELRGGYLPVKYDADRSTKSLTQEALNSIMDQHKAVRAKTRDSFTKGRAAKVVNRPLRKDFGVIFQHLTEVTHRLAWQDWLTDSKRLLAQPAVDEAIRQHYGPLMVEELQKTLDDIATGEVGPSNEFEAAINHLRTGTTVAGLGLNVMTSLLQPLGLTQSMVRIGPTWVMKGLAKWGRMDDALPWIYERSDFMRLRGKTFQREINEELNKIRSPKRSVFNELMFVLIQKGQVIADVPTWLGAYEKAIAEQGPNVDEAMATKLADQAVLDAQSGGMQKDLSRIQRGGSLRRLFTMFYSYFNATHNLAVESVRKIDRKDPITIAKAGLDFLLLYSLPAAISTAMGAALTGEDDEDEFWEKMARGQVSYFLASMVGLREFGAIASGFSGYSGPAGTRFFNEAAKLATQIGQGEADAAFWKALNNAGGIMFHYPAGQINKTLQGASALLNDETDNPAALLFGAAK